MEYKKYFDDFMLLLFNKVKQEGSSEENLLVFDIFKKELDKKMTEGYLEYGDGVFNKSLFNITEELLKEAEDIPGWALILHVINEKNKEMYKKEILEFALRGFRLWVDLKKFQEKVKNIN